MIKGTGLFVYMERDSYSDNYDNDFYWLECEEI